jgi:hypothetical protein
MDVSAGFSPVHCLLSSRLTQYKNSELRRVRTTDEHRCTQMKIVVQLEVKGFFG